VIVKPVLKALLLADNVYKDEATDKDIIAGTIDRLFANEFPTEFKGWTQAYVNVTDVHGIVNLTLQYSDLETNEVLLDIGTYPVSAASPAESVSFGIPVPPLPMPHEGEFAIELYAGEELLGFIRIFVNGPRGEEEYRNGDHD
jgi:hypothetical protein